MITRDNGPICCSSLAVRCSLFTQPFDLFAIDHRTNQSTQCYSMVHMLVPERGNYPFMNGLALYMNGYLNMNGAEPIHVWAQPFLFTCFFEFDRTLSPLRPMYLLSFSPPAKKIPTLPIIAFHHIITITITIIIYHQIFTTSPSPSLRRHSCSFINLQLS